MKIEVPIEITNLSQASSTLSKFNLFAIDKDKRLQQLQQAGIKQTAMVTKAELTKMSHAYAAVHDAVGKNIKKLTADEKKMFQEQLKNLDASIKKHKELNEQLKQEERILRARSNIRTAPVPKSKGGGVVGMGLGAGLGAGAARLVEKGIDAAIGVAKDEYQNYKTEKDFTAKLMLMSPDVAEMGSLEEKKGYVTDWQNKAKKMELNSGLERGSLSQAATDWTQKGGKLKDFDMELNAQMQTIAPELAGQLNVMMAEYAQRNPNASKKEIKDVGMGIFQQSIAGSVDISQMGETKELTAKMTVSSTTAAQKMIQAATMLQAFNGSFKSTSEAATAFSHLFDKFKDTKFVQKLGISTQSWSKLSETGQIKFLRDTILKKAGNDPFKQNSYIKDVLGIKNERELEAINAALKMRDDEYEKLMQSAQAAEATAKALNDIAQVKLKDPLLQMGIQLDNLKAKLGIDLLEAIAKVIESEEDRRTIVDSFTAAIALMVGTLKATSAIIKGLQWAWTDFNNLRTGKGGLSAGVMEERKDFVEDLLIKNPNARKDLADFVSRNFNEDQIINFLFEKYKLRAPSEPNKTPTEPNKTPTEPNKTDNKNPSQPTTITTQTIQVGRIITPGLPVQ